MTKRMEMLVSWMPQVQTAADIGCDHGKCAVAIIEQKKAKRVIATDISLKSCEKVSRIAKKMHLESCMDIRRGDGLKTILPHEAQAALISGMGGLLMAEILQASPAVADTIETFVLQPMSETAGLRRALVSMGFVIADEALLYENHRYYPIIRVLHGQERHRKSIEYDIGWRLIENHDPLLEDWLKKQIGYLQKAQKQITFRGKSDGNEETVRDISSKIKAYEEVLYALHM